MFTHLHLHTQYSLLQGAIQTDALFDRIKALGMNAVAMTDTHNLFGAIDFYTQAKKAGIKPIIGCELNFLPGGRAELQVQTGPQYLHHLTVLCKDIEGYQNLCKLVTETYLETRPIQLSQTKVPVLSYRPIADRKILSKYKKGLIVLSGCLRSELAYKILHGQEEAALQSIEWFAREFGEDFYLELIDSGIPEQDHVNETLFSFGDKRGIRCVGTCDCHYLEAKHAEAHEVLQCIEHGRELDFERPKSLVPSEFYIKSPELMRERLGRFKGAYEATTEIADKCNLEFKFKDEKGRQIYHLPQFRPTDIGPNDPFDLLDYFKAQAHQGLKERFQEFGFQEKVNALDWSTKEQEYLSRLNDELAMISRTGFAGYFLIVADFINWAKTNGIPVGPGRGSGAGSLVAYSLKITDIDPIEFKLLFERFINPERISMPDFDVDFCQDRRGEVIDYVAKRYGSENVSQIITFGKLQARAVIKDVGRVLGLAFSETDQLTKALPQEIDITIKDGLERSPELRAKVEADPKLAKVLEYAEALEGLYRNAGMHAAGVIITEKPVVNYCPLFVGRDGALTTQFDKDFSEQVGLVKFDFLGLKTLTVIDQAIKLIHQSTTNGPEAGAKFELSKMNYKDPKVFALISSGDTDGVFQVESSGMKDLCSRIQPSSLEDITAINALYRPGPLGSGMVDDFIDRKHGRKPINYETPALEPILADTYGVILYQEQVMQIARTLAGYSLGQADLLRRAMGKKKPEEMAQHQQIFVKGAVERGLDSGRAAAIFDLMAKFAEYGFNKSHSAAYGVITYQTAFLKTHFPAEFMAALMTTEMDNTDKLTKYISDARAHNLKVLAPDVNHSQRRFSVELDSTGRKQVRFGLEAIKGVGSIAVDEIIQEREANGKFRDPMDLVKRVPVRKMNRKVLESLVVSGALDGLMTPGLDLNRPSIIESLEGLLDYANAEQEEKSLGQASLFDQFQATEIGSAALTPQNLFKKVPDWPQSRRLAAEKQVTGFYLSSHPLDTWQKICEDWLGWNVAKIKLFAEERAKRSVEQKQQDAGGFSNGGYQRPQRPEVQVAGLMIESREITTKKGSKMAFAVFEDQTAKIELVFFPEAYQACSEMLRRALAEAEPVIVHGELESTDDTAKILVKTLEWAQEGHKKRVSQLVLTLSPSETGVEQLRELKKQLLAHPGKCQLRIHFRDPKFRTDLELSKQWQVAGTPQLVRAINSIFKRDVVQLR